jgi:ketosteroid isomerase-like protein
MRTTTIVLAALTAAGCTTKNAANRADSTFPAAATLAPSTDPAALRRFIDSAQTRFIDAAKKADVATVSGFYTDDAELLVPNAKAAHGRAEIDKANTDMFAAMKVTALKLSTADVITAGDYAIETGSYDQTLQPKTGKTIHDIGKYIVVWKRQGDGSWKIVREIYNTDLPAKAT